MRSQIGGPKVVPPVDFRRVAREFHNVAKQASFETLFFRVPGRFWNDFGRFWEAKMDVKIDFLEVFQKKIDFLKIIVFPEDNCYF